MRVVGAAGQTSVQRWREDEGGRGSVSAAALPAKACRRPHFRPLVVSPLPAVTSWPTCAASTRRLGRRACTCRRRRRSVQRSVRRRCRRRCPCTALQLLQLSLHCTAAAAAAAVLALLLLLLLPAFSTNPFRMPHCRPACCRAPDSRPPSPERGPAAGGGWLMIHTHQIQFMHAF